MRLGRPAIASLLAVDACLTNARPTAPAARVAPPPSTPSLVVAGTLVKVSGAVSPAIAVARPISPALVAAHSAYSGGSTVLPPRCQSSYRVGSVPGRNHSTVEAHSSVARRPERRQTGSATAPACSGSGRLPGG